MPTNKKEEKEMAEVIKFYDVDGRNMRFRNFAGKAGKYNLEGDRNFCLLLNPDVADEMSEEGFNVRYLKPRDDGDDPVPYIQVKLKYYDRSGNRLRPPKIVQITKRGKTELDEETVNNLDWAEIEKFDSAINPRPYENVNGRSGVTAYLKTLYVTIVEDDFEDRYYDVPDSAQNIVDDED